MIDQMGQTLSIAYSKAAAVPTVWEQPATAFIMHVSCSMHGYSVALQSSHLGMETIALNRSPSISTWQLPPISSARL